MVNGLNKVDLKEFLDEEYQEYNNVNFIEQDPIQIKKNHTLQGLLYQIFLSYCLTPSNFLGHFDFF